MRGIVIASAAAFLMSTAVVHAQENSVYVNLSVLNALDAAPATEPAAPQFPIVKAQPKKTAASQKARKKEQKTAAKVKVTVAEPNKPAAKQTEPVSEKAEPAAAPAAEPRQAAPIPFVESTDEVIVVDVEPIASGQADNAAAKQPAPADNELKTAPADIDAAEPAALVKTETAQAPAAEKAKTGAASAAAPQQLLVDAGNALPAVNSKIVFAEEETTLNEAQKAQIDAVVGSFADAANNKIAIYSYNLDDGVDTFRKKRQSLNRAVEIRSYLLQKGFKNFSIKVLNVDGSSDKINSVELEELK
ncbi:MAG: hypothetical protein IJ482_03335 [Alphaproteobacteria bacterium]|nr:hypothetical protein [Alphaproteobacteria bacterium]